MYAALVAETHPNERFEGHGPSENSLQVTVLLIGHLAFELDIVGVEHNSVAAREPWLPDDQDYKLELRCTYFQKMRRPRPYQPV